ncbi:hypothetical protein Poli38472_006586 [Pythium oligandrum]|uniref:Neutral ceramidase n=1 Tax=Pythium oligandrum TaxID=41045 RepID=A0A8K1C517_PYTOL|nr:hypothetical protein Poli38472_006586 [Pythium oligandrum]|eukprot:TMW56576.1 hypothetical protein Poli38472_006586 [Pythium oligandrum]
MPMEMLGSSTGAAVSPPTGRKRRRSKKKRKQQTETVSNMSPSSPDSASSRQEDPEKAAGARTEHETSRQSTTSGNQNEDDVFQGGDRPAKRLRDAAGAMASDSTPVKATIPVRSRRASSASSTTSSVFHAPPPETPKHSELWIGAGMYDITGPAAEVGMFGYAKVGQLTSGIHMRLRARAFAFRHEPTGSACVYVCCDLGMISEWVTQTVISRLSVHPAIPKAAYSRENVMLSATHTHCAPGGMSHYVIYSMHPPLRGADRQNFECVVDGIVEAIVRAHNNLQPGFIRVAKGECLNASVNRSEDAYNANPEEERARYKHNIDKEMTLWRLDGVNGYPIGMINWFAVHPTSMGNWYTLITGDNKGYAAHVFEKEHGTHHLLDRPRAFVAAFAQSNEGDVSPNICGPRHHETEHKDFERMLIVAKAQLKTARDLYHKALYEPPLMGEIRFAHQYVEYGSIKLTERWHVHKECPRSTSSGCIGVSMIGGTTFDGRGVEGIPEGLTWGMYPKVTTMPELQQSQKEKPVLFPSERYGLSPSTLPLQLFLIAGALPIAAVPFEATTMAGRRIRSNLHEIFDELGVETYEPILSGLSNAYSGYLATREEYAVQRYEGASTHFGPNQLSATLQQFEMLAHALTKSKKIKFVTQKPPKISGVGVLDYNVPVVHDGLLPNTQYGGVITDVLKEYHPGSTVTVSFHAAHPKNNLRTQGTFLEVHRWREDQDRPEGGVWVMHADDGDANTFFHWRRRGTFASVVTIEWCIPAQTPPGKYRIKVNGDFKRFFTANVTSYSGVSSAFTVVPSVEEEVEANGHDVDKEDEDPEVQEAEQ